MYEVRSTCIISDRRMFGDIECMQLGEGETFWESKRVCGFAGPSTLRVKETLSLPPPSSGDKYRRSLKKKSSKRLEALASKRNALTETVKYRDPDELGWKRGWEIEDLDV